jgi:catechol 2,3-dioxygenase-like lactoylglutathione lyase family enzyme
VSIPVADQDRALAFYAEVLGCELRTDIEVWPGARLVEVVPPGEWGADRRPGPQRLLPASPGVADHGG